MVMAMCAPGYTCVIRDLEVKIAFMSGYERLEVDDSQQQVANPAAQAALHPGSSASPLILDPVEDQQPLLSSAASAFLHHSPGDSVHDHATASPLSASVNLLNTILGTGLLAMPAALASVGLLPGIIVILFSATASGMGLYFLSCCAGFTEGTRNASFFAISKLTWPNLAIFFDLAIAIKCFGVAVSYLIIIGDLMPQVCGAFPETSIWVDRRFWITVLTCTAVLPLSFLRKLDSLKYTSVIALFAVVYLCAIIVYHFFVPDETAPSPAIELISFSTVIFRRMPVFVFAFTCHQNIFFVYNELKDNSQKRVNDVIRYSITSAGVVYEAIGILGYLTYDPQSTFVAGGRLAIVILVVFSYPLQAHPCRASLDKILAWFNPKTRGHKVPPPPSALKFYVMTTWILVFSYLIAITVSELDVVLAFVGSTGSTTISFILPGIFYCKLHEHEPWEWKKITAMCLAVYGATIMCVCLTYNAMSQFR
ncbi:transmembrane amino acid transporter protein-domain-containing protein [Dichotomocladium elegans]|nr:transmembrane amino acid transporter protein-domain-containing protein [Dichotomocladium elegans]